MADVASTLARALHQEFGTSQRPTIAVDLSLYLWGWRTRAKGVIHDAAAFLTRLSEFSDTMVVCDPFAGERHHTKRVSVKRNSDREEQVTRD